MANTTEVAVLNFIKSELDTNKPAVLAAIQQLEGGVESFIVNAIKTAPKPSGLLGTLYAALEPSLISYVQGLITNSGPEVVFDFIEAELVAEIKTLGG
jgi:hypothetical protein